MGDVTKDIEDVDDELFISKKPQNYIFADKKAQDISDRTTKILNNTRSVVQETEQVGQSTLEMLSSQRETLERVENDLDNINTISRATQKHLNNMRSIFGGIKSLFSNNNSNTSTTISNSRVGLPRSNTMHSVPSDIPAKQSTSATQVGNTSRPVYTPSSSSTVGLQQSSANRSSQPVVDDFEANLSELGFGLGRLKEMATKLGDEIGDHNDMLDRITEKSERAGDSIKHQNRQIQQLLKKG